jgi:hypothetical protein
LSTARGRQDGTDTVPAMRVLLTHGYDPTDSPP